MILANLYLVTRFDSPALAALNVAGILVWLAALVDMIRTPAGDWNSTGRKVFSVLIIAGISTMIAGIYIPVAPAVWFFDWRSKEKWGHHPGRARVHVPA